VGEKVETADLFEFAETRELQGQPDHFVVIDGLSHLDVAADHFVPEFEQHLFFLCDVLELLESEPFEVPLQTKSLVFAVLFLAARADLSEDVIRVIVGP
jgi:hypothetical protein